MYIYMYNMQGLLSAKRRYRFKDCFSHGRFVLLFIYSLQFKGKKNQIYTFIKNFGLD